MKFKIYPLIVLINASLFAFAAESESAELQISKDTSKEALALATDKNAERDARIAEMEKRRAFFESLKEMSPEQRDEAMKAFHASQPAQRARVMLAQKSEAQLNAEADDQIRANLDRQIEALESRMARKGAKMPKASRALSSVKSEAVSEVDGVRDEMDSLQLAYLKQIRASAGLDADAKIQAMRAWKDSAEGKRMRELRDSMNALREAEEYDVLKARIAALNSAEESSDAKTQEVKTRQLAMLERQLENIEFNRQLKNAPAEEQAAMLRDRNEKIRNSMNIKEGDSK